MIIWMEITFLRANIWTWCLRRKLRRNLPANHWAPWPWQSRADCSTHLVEDLDEPVQSRTFEEFLAKSRKVHHPWGAGGDLESFPIPKSINLYNSLYPLQNQQLFVDFWMLPCHNNNHTAAEIKLCTGLPKLSPRFGQNQCHCCPRLWTSIGATPGGRVVVIPGNSKTLGGCGMLTIGLGRLTSGKLTVCFRKWPIEIVDLPKE